MSAEDKMAAAADKAKGKAKETVGRMTDDERLEAEGKKDQAKGHLRDAAENVKDTFDK
ncbi:CsbD family protein [Microbacterium halotolerans]|uniref:CsbD family protein n=1 Tax=Microbacterium halotolerans TaxID=246613 RepID=UPI000E6A99D8|nr:CsbD family protein [Microbacterium halotolerans]